MADFYKTSDVAKIIGIHTNTVRLYEKLNLISKPKRLPNGYRVFTDLHIKQFKLARTAFQVEVLQNGLRRQAIEIVKVCAIKDYQNAIYLTENYFHQIKKERENAEEAIKIVNDILSGSDNEESTLQLKRKEVAEYLDITVDTLRNWELNGLITIKRKSNGYRVYNYSDIKRLKIIRSLRCANYSLSAILRMLNELSNNPSIDIKEVIDTPKDSDDIISVCDKLLTSLNNTKLNAKSMYSQIEEMKDYELNPTL